MNFETSSNAWFFLGIVRTMHIDRFVFIFLRLLFFEPSTWNLLGYMKYMSLISTCSTCMSHRLQIHFLSSRTTSRQFNERECYFGFFYEDVPMASNQFLSSFQRHRQKLCRQTLSSYHNELGYPLGYQHKDNRFKSLLSHTVATLHSTLVYWTNILTVSTQLTTTSKVWTYLHARIDTHPLALSFGHSRMGI